jgi:hypothetical protein
MARASSWDPPVIDPRLTQSVGLYQFAGLVYNRLLRYRFTDEANGTNDLSLVGDLAESWESSSDHRVWTFKLRQGVKWQNVAPLNGRELVARRRQVLLRGLRQGRRAVLHVPRDRGDAGAPRCAFTSRRPMSCSRRTWRSRSP